MNKLMKQRIGLVEVVYNLLLAAYLESFYNRALKLYYIRSLKDLIDDRLGSQLTDRPSPIKEFSCTNGWIPASVLIQQPGIDFQPGALNAIRKLRKRKTVNAIEVYRNADGHTLYRLVPNQGALIEEMKEKESLKKEEEVK